MFHKLLIIRNHSKCSRSAQTGARVQISASPPKHIPQMIQLCHLRYRYFIDKNTKKVSTYKNKRCILDYCHLICNAFFIAFISYGDLTWRNSNAIVKILNFVERLKKNVIFVSGKLFKDLDKF